MPTAQVWTDEQIEAAVKEFELPVVQDLLNLCRKMSVDGSFNAGGENQGACFGYRLNKRDGSGPIYVFSCMLSYKKVYVYLKHVRQILNESDFSKFGSDIANLFNRTTIQVDPEIIIPLDEMELQYNKFEALMQWLRKRSVG
jgi:hypothetical protein